MRDSTIRGSIKAATSVVLSASGEIRRAPVAVDSSDRRASSGGTGDATMRSGDSGRDYVGVARRCRVKVTACNLVALGGKPGV